MAFSTTTAGLALMRSAWSFGTSHIQSMAPVISSAVRVLPSLMVRNLILEILGSPL